MFPIGAIVVRPDVSMAQQYTVIGQGDGTINVSFVGKDKILFDQDPARYVLLAAASKMTGEPSLLLKAFGTEYYENVRKALIVAGIPFTTRAERNGIVIFFVDSGLFVDAKSALDKFYSQSA